jgi:hypothetical protein
MVHPTTGSRRQLNTPMVQNFHLVWLGGDIDEVNNSDYRDSITKLRQVFNTVNAFVDVDECIDFITDINEKTFMVISQALSQIIISIVQDIPQVTCVYIFCQTVVRHGKRTKLLKVSGIYTDITAMCEAFRQDTRLYDHNSVSISVVQKTDGAKTRTLDTLDSSFMYTQILKEILLTIDFEQVHFNEFYTYCCQQ